MGGGDDDDILFLGKVLRAFNVCAIVLVQLCDFGPVGDMLDSGFPYEDSYIYSDLSRPIRIIARSLK